MNKWTKLLSVFVIAGAIGAGVAGVAGCKKKPSGNDGCDHNYSWVDNGDGTHDEKCGNCNDVRVDDEAHDWGEDGKCKKCPAVKPAEETVAVTGVSLSLEKYSLVVEKSVTLSAIITPAKATNQNVKWKSSDDTVATVSDKGVVTAKKEGSATITVTTDDGAKTAECVITVKASMEYDLVPTACDLTALWEKFGNKNKLTEDYVFGKFTFSQGVYFDSTGDITGNTVNTQKKDLYFNLTGYDNENTIQFDAKSASTGANPTFALINMATGEKVWEQQITTVTKGIKIENLPAGYYKFTSDTSSRLGNISILEKLEKSEASGITVKNPTLKVLSGRELQTSALEVYLDYDNGRQDRITNFTINDDGFANTTPGKQKIKVEYTPEGASAPFTADVEVLVYAIDSVKLSDYSCALTRVTMPVQKIFKLGDTFNSNNLAVIATCSATGVDGTEEFILNNTEYTISTPDNNTTGKQTVKVTTANNKEGSYDVYFVSAADVDSTKVTVDGAAETVSLNTETKVYTVKTVNQAIQMFKALEAADDVEKVITLKNGEYKEKVEIDLPNISLVGEGTDAGKNVLWFDLIAGFKDPSGTTAYSTDGSASVSIRADAVGFHAENVTFKNYWNTNALYKESTKLHGDTQAVAILIQSDMTTFKNCNFTGYHDTLYAMEGRHVFEDCYIEGRTDYIFGATATSYFKNCTIKTLGANDEKNGGYIVATKGSGAGGMNYGYIFNGCTLIGDDSVVPGTVSLARGWDVGMTLAFINCNISNAYSTEYYGYTESNKNDRYTKMNAAPNPAQLFEYNNSGDGALTKAILDTADPTTHVIPNMCTILTESEAAVYNNLATVFAADNGTVKYQKDWDGTKKVVVPPVSYKFGVENMGTAYEADTVTDENGIELFAGAMTVYAQNGAKFKTENSKNYLWLGDGCVVKMNVAGKVFFDTYGGEYGMAENVSVNYVNGKATVTIKATENSPIKNKCCIKVITLDKMVVPEHEHQYGAWDITTAPAPTTKGSASRTCTECEEATPHVDTKELPELTVENYNYTASQNAGKLIYTLKTDETISFEADALKGLHAHSYGDWTVTATLAAAGKATKTCTNSTGTCDAQTVEVDIPALTDTQYTITNNTATLEAGGTGTYSITVDGEVITFVAETAKLEVARWTESGTYQYGGSGDPVSTDKILFVGCGNSGGWVLYGKNAYVALNLPEGAVLKITRSPYDNAEKIKINGVEQEGLKNTTVTYTVKVPGYVVISADNTAYFKTIEVTIDPDYRHTAHAWSEWTITAPTADAPGSATRHCLVPECGLAGETQNKELPALSADDYNITASETAGKSIYTLKSETSISFEADSLAGLHVHNYGDVWTYDAENSKITKTCTADGECDEPTLEVTVPALTDARYTITNNTATLEAAGTGTYTIVLDEVTYSFTAATPQIVLETISIAKEFSAANGLTDKQLYFKSVTVQDSKYWVFGTGAQIKFNVDAGAKIVFYCDYWGGGIVVSGCGGTLTDGDDAAHKSYTAVTAGLITIDLTSGASQAGYLRTINVSYELQTAEVGYKYTWSNPKDGDNYTISKNTVISSPDNKLEFNGCKANDDWLAFGGNGSSIKLKVAVGNTIKIQASQWDAGYQINGEAVTKNGDNVLTYVVTGESDVVEVVITSTGGSSYLKTIEVTETTTTPAE